MSPIKKKALEMAMNNPVMVEYFMSPHYALETYSTGQEKRRARREQKMKSRKK